MILDDLKNFSRYQNLHPSFNDAIKFLNSIDFATFTSGRKEISVDRVFATASISAGKGIESAKLEVHRKFIDIQFSVNGIDNIGWKPLSKCTLPETDYNRENDVQLFSDVPDTWFGLSPSTFAIFFPEDAHAPLAVQGMLHKIIVKVHI